MRATQLNCGISQRSSLTPLSSNRRQHEGPRRRHLRNLLSVICGVLALWVWPLTAQESSAGAQFQRGLEAFDSRQFETAFNVLEGLALDGNAPALAVAGFLLEHGKGTAKNPAEAMRFYRAGAQRNHARSQTLLGQGYERGLDGDVNLERARHWYQVAVENGDNQARFKLAAMYREGRGVERDLAKALDLLREGALQGHLAAERALAEFTEQLRSGKTDSDQAQLLKWFERSAAEGDANAQAQLGYLYETGKGVERNYARSFDWTLQAALQGQQDAQAALGYLYHLGYGIERSFVEAIAWYRKAAEQGNTIAMNNLGYMHLKGQGLKPDSARAAELYLQAAELGNAYAQSNIGNLYSSGTYQPARGPEFNAKAEALSWYRKAAEQGLAHAQTSLGFVYQTGAGAPQSYPAAIKWYRLAAEQEDAQAQGNLAYLYQEGLGTPVDTSAAIALYEKAAANGYGYAQRNLGRVYQFGLGVDRDLERAVEWYRKAAANGDQDAGKLAAKVQAEIAKAPRR